MTTTDKGIIRIDFDDNNQPKVIFKPVDADIWLYKNELIELFGVYAQTISCVIDTVYKNKAYRPEETSEYHLYQSGNVIKHDKYRFNLTIVIALAFHLDSWQAKLIREWFVNMVLRGNSVIDYPSVTNKQDFRMN